MISAESSNKVASTNSASRRGYHVSSLYVLRLLQRVIATVLFVCLFYVITFSYEFNLVTRYTIASTICIVLTLFTRGKFAYKLRFSRYTVAWALLLLTMIIALAFSNGAYEGVRDYALIYVLYIVVVSRGLSELDNSGYSILSVALIIAADLVVYRSLSEAPLTTTMYRGIMSNPNSLGSFLVAPLAGTLFLFCASKSRVVKIILIAELMLFTYILYCTSCRSALVAFIIAIIIVSTHIVNESVNDGSAKLYVKRFAIISCIVLIIMLYSSQLVALIQGNILKWGTSAAKNDLSSGRIEMWRYVLDNVPFFGWGDVFIHCHNDFILWLELYGWVSALTLIFLLAMLSVESVRQYLQSKTLFTLFNTIFIINCIVVSSFEEILGIFGRPLVIMLFIAIGNVVALHNKSLREINGAMHKTSK